MNKPLCVLAIVSSVIGGLAQAEITAETGAYNKAFTDVPDGQGFYKLIEDWDYPGSTTGGSSQAVAQTSDSDSAAYGYSGTVASRYENNQLSSSLDFNWSASGGTTGRVTNIDGNTRTWVKGDIAQSQAGRIRFTVNYDLAVENAGQSSDISFIAYIRRLEGNSVESDIASSYKGIAIGEGPQSLSGTWTSDWYYFSSTDDIKNAEPEFTESFHFMASTSTGQIGDFAGPLTPEGHTSSYANLSFSYEIAPVPEPETYALMGAGVLALAFARRRRSV